MTREEILEQLEDCPIIAAVKDEEGLKTCIESDIQVAFVIYGDICSIGDIVGRLKDAGKTVFIHLDLISGLSSREVVVHYICQVTRADGIISTKPALIKQAKEEGLFAIMRFFMLDSMVFENVGKQISNVHPDVIEIIPGAMPKVVEKLCHYIGEAVPVIAGGMIMDKEDTMAALNAGAGAISTSNQKVWFM